MKRLVLSALALGLSIPAAAVPALADPPAAVSAPGVYVAPVLTVRGRPNKPMVSIVIRTPSAAAVAGAAQDRHSLETLARSQPAAMTGR